MTNQLNESETVLQ